MTSKGQLTVPVEVRRRLGLTPGTRVSFEETDDGSYRLRARTGSVRDLKGILPPPERPVTIEEMNEAIAQGAVAGAGL